MKGQIPVAVVDSYALIMYAVSNQLQLSGFNVTIEAKSGVDFIEQAVKCRFLPKVCLLDIDTPTIEEFETAKQIKMKYPDIKIVAYTLFEQEYSEIKKFGIDAFVKKSCSMDYIKRHIYDLLEV